jgi:hypothetical protein
MRKTVAAAFFLLAGLGLGYCQAGIVEIPGPPDASRYRDFFNQVAFLRSSPVVGAFTEQFEVRVTRPTLQEAIGVTDAEAASLTAISKDCGVKLSQLDGTPGPSKFEALMRSIESGETLAQLEQRMKELDERRDQVVRDHVEQLKTALGDSRFQVVDAFVRGKTPSDFFPMIGAPTITPRVMPVGK